MAAKTAMARDGEGGADVTVVVAPPAGGAMRRWAPLMIGAVLGALLLSSVAQRFRFDPGEAGLGRDTTGYFGEPGAPRTHCADNLDTRLCEKAYRDAGSPPAVLWLGNSQLHGINQYRPGQANAPAILHGELAAQGRYLVTYSEPNANLFEHRLLFQRLAGIYDIRTLLLPVCLDDFRENGIRPELAAPPAASDRSGSADGQGALQTRVEAKLDSALDGAPLWKDRNLLGKMALYGAYTIRNRIMGINAQTPRPVPPAVYAEKMAVLHDILAQAASRNIKVVLYAPPYRSDVRGPYDRLQYAAFLDDLNRLADGDKVRFFDLTSVVPGPEWGMLTDPLFGFSDYDFMHFSAEGHKRLAAALVGKF